MYAQAIVDPILNFNLCPLGIFYPGPALTFTVLGPPVACTRFVSAVISGQRATGREINFSVKNPGLTEAYRGIVSWKKFLIVNLSSEVFLRLQRLGRVKMTVTVSSHANV